MNIAERLHENRQIELAKSILESKGYKVTKDRNKVVVIEVVNESTGWGDWRDNSHGEPYPFKDYKKGNLVGTVYDATKDGEGYVIDFWDNDIAEEHYVKGLTNKSFKNEEDAMKAVEDYLSKKVEESMTEAESHSDRHVMMTFRPVHREPLSDRELSILRSTITLPAEFIKDNGNGEYVLTLPNKNDWMDILSSSNTGYKFEEVK